MTIVYLLSSSVHFYSISDTENVVENGGNDFIHQAFHTLNKKQILKLTATSKNII